MNGRIIRTGEVELATQRFGDPSHPPVILIMGGMASMLWWHESFCRRLAEQGRFVIRYDQRDSGLSTKYPPGQPGYTFDDAVDDVFRVLDGYGISTAHIVGFSLGGMVGQGAALKIPERVHCLTAISTSPVGVVAGTAHPFDEAGTRAFVERDFDRAGGYLSATNHSILFEIGVAWRDRLHEMKTPLLVIHGSADPIFPVEHGMALSQAVAGSKFMRLEGGGHELHPGHWDQIVDAVVEHARAG